MKAIVCTKYGSPDYLRVQEVNVPLPGKNEVQVKVYASSITAADSMMRQAKPFISRFFLGFTRPRQAIIGTGFAGVVEAVGEEVSEYQIGEEVFGETGVNFGANAEYLCVSENGVLMPKPPFLSFEEAATLCDGPLTSYNFLKNLGKLKRGQKVLINGASGSLGTAAVQIATYCGTHVTGVCSSRNTKMVQNLGVDEIIDYTQADFTKNGEQYDLIYDTVGKLTFAHCKASLTTEGVYLTPVLGFSVLYNMLKTSWRGGKKAIFSATGLLPALDLRAFLNNLLMMAEKRKLKIIIDQAYPLEEATQAHRYVDTGRKKGNVVLVI